MTYFYKYHLYSHYIKYYKYYPYYIYCLSYPFFKIENITSTYSINHNNPISKNDFDYKKLSITIDDDYNKELIKLCLCKSCISFE